MVRKGQPLPEEHRLKVIEGVKKAWRKSERYKGIVVMRCKGCGKQYEMHVSTPRQFCSLDCWYEYRRDKGRDELKRLYWQDGLSMQKIADKMGITKQAIRSRMVIRGINRRSYKREISTYPSPDLSYLIGVLLGDGYVYVTQQRGGIQLNAKEPKFIESVKMTMERLDFHVLGPYESINTQFKEPKKILRISASSRQFAIWFKQLTLSQIKEIVRLYSIDFLRGFYESEGSRGWYKSGNGYRFLSVSVSNKREDILSMFAEFVGELGLRTSISRRKDGCCVLYVLGKPQDKLSFLQQINPSIKGAV